MAERAPRSRRDETSLVATLTARDLWRNVGSWRLPVMSSVIFVMLFISTAFTTGNGQDFASSLRFKVAVDGDVDGGQAFLDTLEASRFEIEVRDDSVEAVREGEAAIGLRLPPGLDAALDGHVPTTVEVTQRSEHNLSQEATGWLIVTLAQEYGSAVPALTGAVTIDEIDIADDPAANRDQFARTYAGLLAFLALGVITSVAGILGGTRDRRGADALLVLPLRRRSLAAGIAAGASPLGIVQVSIGALGLLLVALLPFPTLGLPADVLLGAVPLTVLAAVLLTATAASLGVVAGALGGGSSDSMGVGDLLAMPLAAIGVTLLIVPDLGGTTALYAAPALGPLLLVRDAVLGDAPPGAAVLACAGTAAACWLLIALGGRLLRGERNVRRL
jgi:ABC-type Na+ efflux pump permease subunit